MNDEIIIKRPRGHPRLFAQAKRIPSGLFPLHLIEKAKRIGNGQLLKGLRLAVEVYVEDTQDDKGAAPKGGGTSDEI